MMDRMIGFILLVHEDVGRLGLVANHSRRRTTVSLNPQLYGVLGNLDM